MTLPANIRVNVRVPFPSLVGGAAFVSVNKSNGVWTIKPDYRLLALSSSIGPNQVIALQDVVTGVFSYTPVSQYLPPTVGQYRLITSAGAAVALSTDVALLVNPSPAGAVTIQLLASAARNGSPIIIKDYAGLANTNHITIAPASGETIDGLSASAAVANGIAVIDVDYGSLVLYPLTSGGWYTVK